MNLKEIKKGMPGISPVAGCQLYEACICCMHKHGHPEKVIFQSDEDLSNPVEVVWTDEFNDQMERTWTDQEYCTEHGAVCVSALMVLEKTDYTIIERARKGTGVDYWLGNDDQILFQKSARLEVSGIFKGDKSDIDKRLKTKLKQVVKSDSTMLPVFISIVEFSKPFFIFAPKQIIS